MERVTGGRWRHFPEGEMNISGINFYPPYVTQDDLLATVREDDMVFLRADPPANLGALVRELPRLSNGVAQVIY